MCVCVCFREREKDNSKREPETRRSSQETVASGIKASFHVNGEKNNYREMHISSLLH